MQVHESRWRVALLLIWLVVQAACVWFYFAGSLRVMLLLVTGLAGVWASWQPARIERLDLGDAGRVHLRVGGVDYAAKLGAGSLIGWRCALLRWHFDDGRVCGQWLLPDSLRGDDWRRLTLWLQFGQKE